MALVEAVAPLPTPQSAAAGEAKGSALKAVREEEEEDDETAQQVHQLTATNERLIEQLQQSQGHVAALTAELDGAQGTLKTTESEVVTLTRQVAELTSQLDAAEERERANADPEAARLQPAGLADAVRSSKQQSPSPSSPQSQAAVVRRPPSSARTRERDADDADGIEARQDQAGSRKRVKTRPEARPPPGSPSAARDRERARREAESERTKRLQAGSERRRMLAGRSRSYASPLDSHTDSIAFKMNDLRERRSKLRQDWASSSDATVSGAGGIRDGSVASGSAGSAALRASRDAIRSSLGAASDGGASGGARRSRGTLGGGRALRQRSRSEAGAVQTGDSSPEQSRSPGQAAFLTSMAESRHLKAHAR